MNYRGFDFGTLFCEFGFAATDEQLATDPHFSFDSCNYPSADTMRSMFAMYAATVSGPAARSGTPSCSFICYYCTSLLRSPVSASRVDVQACGRILSQC